MFLNYNTTFKVADFPEFCTRTMYNPLFATSKVTDSAPTFWMVFTTAPLVSITETVDKPPVFRTFSEHPYNILIFNNNFIILGVPKFFLCL